MAISLPDARQLSDEVLQSLRLRALRGCELGYSEIEVAELLGLARETVSRWWTADVDHGLEAPQATAPAARSALVVNSTTGKSARHADDALTKKAPRRWGSPRCGPARDRSRVDPQGVLGSTCRCGS